MEQSDDKIESIIHYLEWSQNAVLLPDGERHIGNRTFDVHPVPEKAERSRMIEKSSEIQIRYFLIKVAFNDQQLFERRKDRLMAPTKVILNQLFW